MKYILLFSLCIIPALLILWYIYNKDKKAKEPKSLLITLFIGGIVGAIITLLITIILKEYLPFLNLKINKLNVFEIFIKYVLTIGLLEEGIKWLINYLSTWKNKNFDHIFDSIIYCTFISLGFATFENIIYALSYSNLGVGPILLRGITSVPAHAVFGIFMGYYIGLAKEQSLKKRKSTTKDYLFLSLFVPVVLHALFDLLLINDNFIFTILFLLYLFGLYMIAFGFLSKLNKTNKTLHKKTISKK